MQSEVPRVYTPLLDPDLLEFSWSVRTEDADETLRDDTIAHFFPEYARLPFRSKPTPSPARGYLRRLNQDVYRMLLDAGEEIGLATVYRVLSQFESAGLVTRHHFEGGTAVFELNEGEHHDHIVCVDCGRVEEFTDDSIEDRQREIASRLGFEISDHSLTLHGHCVRENCPHRRKQP